MNDSNQICIKFCQNSFKIEKRKNTVDREKNRIFLKKIETRIDFSVHILYRLLQIRNIALNILNNNF